MLYGGWVYIYMYIYICVCVWMDSMYLVAYYIRYGDIYCRTCVPPCPLAVPFHS
jgi:hypothetical protein